jgi:rare lipoprotein A
MYIQAGAFARYDNANRLSARLQSLGLTKITQVNLGDQVMFRVRLGPIPTLPQADNLLDRIVKAGYPDARLIVD